MKRRSLLAALAAAPALPILSACGGGELSDGPVSLRLVNASTGYDTLDLYLDGDSTIEGVAKATCSDIEKVGNESFSASLRSGDSGVQLFALDVEFSGEKHYTLVAYGAVGSLSMVLLTEDEDDGEEDYAKLRVFNAASDAGVLDVLVGAAGGSVDPVFSDVAIGKETEFIQIAEGNKRIAVAPQSDDDDLRFDVDGVELRDGQVATLVLAPTSGGGLVSALLVTERGDVSTYENSQARLRVVAGLSGGGNPRVAVSVDDVDLTTSQASATVGNYKLVTAGASMAITANGQSVASPSATTKAGGDYSLVVFGSATDPLALLLTDDNRAPIGTNKARIRVVHASFADAAATMSVDIDADTIASAVDYGGTEDVNVASQVLLDGATYTLFLLGSSDEEEPVVALLRLDNSTT